MRTTRFPAAVPAVVAAPAAFTPEPQWTGVKFRTWGLDSGGQFGDGSTADGPVPTLVGRSPGRPYGSARIRQVATGGTFSAGIDDRGVRPGSGPRRRRAPRPRGEPHRRPGRTVSMTNRTAPPPRNDQRRPKPPPKPKNVGGAR
ncbi:RCC1 domain-containing protein [Herbidospora cretacea]|uniref:RCC1 domain-containing protein n=1 Tax=Herbidospora cretacea TaxID=28444 RepID=UPI0018CC56E1|nr:RCC1 domain-containing protein [Herbidospora cretacea]